MEPLNDRELKEYLRNWQAPNAPPGLEGRIFAKPGMPWWRWLLTGSVRVPVPAGILALLLLAFIAYSSFSSRKAVTLSDFQPVKQLEPRVIQSANDRSVYEAH